MMGTGGRAAAAAAHHTLAGPGGASLAYARVPARRTDLPGVVFCGGFRSDMGGIKARRLEAFCAARGQGYVRFDYRGHGASGGAFADGTIGGWRDDALAILDHVTEGPQILVGSSMGAWIALLAALARPGRVAGLVGVAAAVDCTEDLVWARLDGAQRAALLGDGVLLRPSAYDTEPYPFTRALVEEGRRHLLLRGAIRFDRPVRLLHGMADPDVPWAQSRRLLEALTGGDARLVLIKDGDHRLSREADLVLIEAAVAELSDAASCASGARPGTPRPG